MKGVRRDDCNGGFDDHVVDAIVLFQVEEEFPEFGAQGFGVEDVFVGMRETDEGFGEVFVALGFVLVDEAVPEFHEADFSGGAVGEVF